MIDTNSILLGLFLISYVLMIAALIKGYNPSLVLLGTGILWAVLGGMNLEQILNELISGQFEAQAVSFMTIIFGAWFAQVMIKTGIVKTIIRTAVELGGDNPKVLIAIIMIVVSVMFTSLYSIGPVIAVGVIVLPVMISLGIPSRISIVAYGLSVAVAQLLNVSQYVVMRGLLSYIGEIPETMTSPWTPYAFIAFGIGVVVSIAGVLVMYSLSVRKKPVKRARKVKSWAVKKTDSEEITFVPWYVCVATIIPVVLMMVFKVNIFASFIIGILYAICTAKITYRKLRIFPLFSKTFKAGAGESAGMIMYMACVYTVATGASSIRPVLQETLGGILPQTTLGLTIFMIVLVPLFMYRGPLALAGAGAAVYATIFAVGSVPVTYLWLLCFAGNSVYSGVDPTNSTNVWTCSYAKVKPFEFIKTALPVSWVYAVCILGFLYYMHG